ncbi:MAG TPA: metallophosphoesterase family protein [Solirubrobacteraceae bacterium]|nr:metallophosphoesterase family protein [Solirubrobacteraceae bacterium]
MRVAALYDIHGNLPALEAVLADVEADVVVVGGDVAPGPQVAECFARLDALEVPVRWVRGNGDREELGPELLERFEETVELEGVLFCHGSPRSDEEMITLITSAERLRPMLEDVAAHVVVCGHTHHQFDRRVSGKRVVNAGSVGLPYQGDAAAFWLALDDGRIQLRRTAYDVAPAVELFRAMPELAESVQASLVEPISAQAIAEHFEQRATTQRDGQ